METREFKYDVSIVIIFSREELELIRNCCENHYDGWVKNIHKNGGFLYGWFNKLHFDEKDGLKTEFTCRSRQLDTCGKALEQPSAHVESDDQIKARGELLAKIKMALHSINDEWSRMNASETTIEVTDDMDVACYSLCWDGSKLIINVVSSVELEALPEWITDTINIGRTITSKGITYGPSEESLSRLVKEKVK